MDNIKNVVSMLVAEKTLTLITAEGEVLAMTIDGPHDTDQLAEYLTPKLDGKSVIPVNLSDYLSSVKALSTPEFEEEGIFVTQIVNGRSIQGIFYPQKIDVSVQVEGGSSERVVIPNVDNLEKHMKRAADDGSPSVRNFLKRLAPVVKDRLHSAEDLMKFIKRSDMPLTDDGLIIGYKRVNKRGEDYVDCHSGNITQRVGDHVWMDVDGVDPSRNRSCSHGLHVANLGYLSGFSGSNTLIVLVKPEDFIAVPNHEETKCRVCAYDIVGVLSDTVHKKVGDSFIDGDVDFESLISRTVNGERPQILRSVKVGQRRVEEIVLLDQPETTAKPAPKKSSAKASGKSLETIKTREKNKDILKMAKQSKKSDTSWNSAPSEVMAVFDAMIAQPDESKAALARRFDTSTRTIGRWCDKYDFEGYQASLSKNMTVAEKAMAMFKAGQFEALRAFKSAKKKSWAALGGFTDSQVKKIEST